jgi:hypothetical protein
VHDITAKVVQLPELLFDLLLLILVAVVVVVAEQGEAAGVTPVGMKVFVSVCQMVDGWENQSVTFAAVVPASA